MRTLLLCLAVAWFALFTDRLGVGQPAPADPPYTRGLLASLQAITKRWGHIDDSAGGTRIRTDWKQTIVEKRPGITDGMPSKIDGFRIQYLDGKALIERHKKVGKDFSLVVINPMTKEAERLKIQYNIVWFRYEKDKPSYLVSDWSIVYFRLDGARREYVVDQVKLGGV